MLNCIKGELYKAINQIKMMIFLIVLAGAPVIGAIGTLILKSSSNIGNSTEVVDSLTFTSLEYPLVVLSGVIELLIPVFIVILVSDSITEDYIKGTLKNILVTPLKRNTILLAKIITIGIEIVAFLGVLLVSSYVTGFIFFDNPNEFVYHTTTLSINEGVLYTLLAYFITFLVLMVFTLVVVLIALKFKSTGSIIGITVGLIVTSPIVSLMSSELSKLLITNYFKFYEIIFHMGTNYHDLFQGLSIIAGYGIISYIFCTKIFYKKDILY